MGQLIGCIGTKRTIDNDDFGLVRPAQRLEAGFQALSPFDTDARFHKPRFHGRSFERRIGDDKGAGSVGRAPPRFLCGEGANRPAFRQADGERKDGSSKRIIGERELAAHQANQLARDRQPKPRALEAPRVRPVALFETVENCCSPILRHARPGVDHREPHGAVLAALNCHANAALVGEFDRIGREIGENLAQTMAVGANEPRRNCAERGGDLKALTLGARREQLDHAFRESA